MKGMDDQVERLLEAGRLTLDEARRLRGAENAGAGFDRLEKRIALHRVRYQPLLASVLLLLLVEAILGWLGTPLAVLIYTTAIVLPLVLLAGLAARFYNGLVVARERADADWLELEQLYQRRLDLIPLLIDSVTVLRIPESAGPNNDLSEARARALSAMGFGSEASGSVELPRLMQAQNDVQRVQNRLLAVLDRADAATSESDAGLRERIADTESRIARALHRYNADARRYNDRLGSFPGSLAMRWGGFGLKHCFEV
ncbi:MAG: LemA family protein [Oceanospirillaceae bacterium]|nr:LemA family protein [Oceanospirillaceae bacterium]